jgi:hypothetical protein
MKKIYAIFGAALIVALAGCGSTNQAGSTSSGNSSNSTSLQTKLISSVSATSNASTARMALTVSTSGSTAVNISSNGTYDFTKKQGDETTQLSSADSTGGSYTLEQVLDGTTAYEKLPASLAGMANAKPWIKFDLGSIGQSIGVNFSGLTQGQSSDPSQGLTMLLGASDDVTKVGTEQVRDAQTTHYKATLDFNTAASRETDATRKAALQQFAKLYNNQTIPVDVWVDSDNRIRKMTSSVDLSKLNLGSVATSTTAAITGIVTTTVEFYDFGTPVNVTIPAPDQVSDLSSLTGGASAS